MKKNKIVKKIWITGNGVFLDNNDSLLLDKIHKRMDEHFKTFTNEILGEHSKGFPKLMKELNQLKIINDGDDFHFITDKFWNEFTSSQWDNNYEEKMGIVIEQLLNYANNKKNVDDSIEKINNFFKEVYSYFVNVIQCVLFMKLPDKRTDMKSTYPKAISENHYTFNILSFDDNTKHLHGKYWPIRWFENIDNKLIAATGKKNQEDLVIFAENIAKHPLLFDPPMIFGKNIPQKVLILKTLKNYQETKNKKILAAFERNIPYLALKKDAKDNEIHIYGVSVTSHKEIIEWLSDANKIIWYWYSETDKKQLEQIKNPKLHIKKYDKVD